MKKEKQMPLCPLCGMDSGRRMEDEHGRCYVICESCGAIAGPYANSSAATKGWQSGKVRQNGKKKVSGM